MPKKLFVSTKHRIPGGKRRQRMPDCVVGAVIVKYLQQILNALQGIVSFFEFGGDPHTRSRQTARFSYRKWLMEWIVGSVSWQIKNLQQLHFCFVIMHLSLISYFHTMMIKTFCKPFSFC